MVASGPAVKRVYSSAVRQQRARQTARAVVSAAARLFVEPGYGQTTIEDVAAAAGVSRKTVFAVASGKVDLLRLAIDWATVGDHEPVPLADRPEIRRIASAPDVTGVMRAWARSVSGSSARLAGLSSALTVAAGLDPQARQLHDDAQAQRLVGANAFVSFLSDRFGLRPGLSLDDAADLVWLHSDPVLYSRLVAQRQWPPDRFEDWLTTTVTGQLFGSEGSTA